MQASQLYNHYYVWQKDQMRTHTHTRAKTYGLFQPSSCAYTGNTSIFLCTDGEAIW